MTAQIHEILILDGNETSMAFCPPLPDDPSLAVPVADEELTNEGGIYRSTACWRRYRGTWEIRDRHFWLVALDGRFRLNSSEPVPADWFTGVLRVPRGDMLAYVHMGFGSVYEEELHITIERGVVTQTKVMDNRGEELDLREIARTNLPGGENRFAGDDDL